MLNKMIKEKKYIPDIGMIPNITWQISLFFIIIQKPIIFIEVNSNTPQLPKSHLDIVNIIIHSILIPSLPKPMLMDENNI